MAEPTGFRRLSDVLKPATSSIPSTTQTMPTSPASTPRPNDAQLRDTLARLDSLEADPLLTSCPTCGGTGAIEVESPAPPNGPRYARCACQDESEREHWLSEAGIPERFQRQDFGSFATVPGSDASALQAVMTWADTGSDSLWLYGAENRGKTGLAIAALTWRIRHGQRGTFVKVPDLLAEIRASFDRSAGALRPSEILDAYRTVPLLVLDDLGAELVSEWAEEALYRLIDHRHDHLRPTIVTTNLGAADGKTTAALMERVGRRVTWRLVEMCRGNVVRVAGANLRPVGA